jgi:Green fluorescent protein
MKDLALTSIEEQEDALFYTAKLQGRVNNDDILVTGSGRIVLSEGLTEGDYEIEKSPKDFSPLFLTAVLITGYPNACVSIDGSKNLFHGSSYHYNRALAFRQGGNLTMTAKCSLIGEHLDSEFTLVGDVPRAELDEVEPLVEVWEPIGNHEIAGQFRIAWKKSGKLVISADAKSQYHPGNSTELMPILHRYISIVAKLESCRFSLKQKSLIFHQLSSVND